MQQQMIDAFKRHFKDMSTAKLKAELRLQEKKALEFPNANSKKMLELIREELKQRD